LLLKIKNKIAGAVFVFAVAGFSSCAIQDVEFVKMNNYSVSKLSDNEAQITLNVKLDNPNNFKIKITKANLDLTVGGNNAGKVDIVDKITLRKKAEDDYDIVIEVDPEKIMSAALKSGVSILLSGKVVVRVKGWVKGRAFGIGAKVDVDESHEIDGEKIKSF
jgi:LEA14-like dessication related protein